MQLTDATLCERARAGDANAFGLLFERHHKAIYNFCFRRLGDWSVAEDTLSLVFLVAWRRRAKAPPEKILPWLYGIATNVIRNQRRAERRFRKALEHLRESQRELVPDEGAEMLREDERVMRHLLGLLTRLPQREQDVFVLCTWMGLSYEDAAFALGVPIGTVRSRLARARGHLRELNPEFGHSENKAVITVEGGSHEH